MGADTERSFVSKRRRVPRRVFTRRIGLLVDGEYHINRSHEVGEGGMLFSSDVPLAEGKSLLISFQVPGNVHVIVRAKVRYLVASKEGNSGHRYGAEFETIDFASKRLIRNYVASKSAVENIVEKNYI